MNANDDLFLTVCTYGEEGTMEQRWGPAGYIVCRNCGDYHVCHWKASLASVHGSYRCKECGGEYIWVEKKSLEAANPHIIEERNAILNRDDSGGCPEVSGG